MRFGVVGALVRNAGGQRERSAIGKLGIEPAFEAEQDVTLGAPVVGSVAGAVLDHAHPNWREVPGPPDRNAVFAPMPGRLDR